MAQRHSLLGIITVVDSKHIVEHLQEEKPEGVENESVEQLAFADRIIMNKTDLISPEELVEVQKEVQKINSHAEIIHAQYSKVEPRRLRMLKVERSFAFRKLINISAFSLDRVLEMDPEFMDTEGEHQHDTTVSSISFKFEGECNVNKLERWISIMLKLGCMKSS